MNFPICVFHMDVFRFQLTKLNNLIMRHTLKPGKIPFLFGSNLMI